MKYVFALLVVLLNTLCFAQAFHFNDVQTILVKTTDESPAHWYLEIFSDVPSDTTLRWKAHYGPTLPAEWDFNFDVQSQFHFPVLDNDSADFTLISNPILPQKLIIGAMLNNTPGNGSIYFDVYDPNDLSTLVTIEYRFVVTMGSGTMGLEEQTEGENWFTQSDRTFVFPKEFVSNKVVLYNTAGRSVYAAKIESDALVLPADLEAGVYFLTMTSSNTAYSRRVVLD